MKNKKGMIYGVLLMTCLVIGLSYGAFIFSTDKYRSSELLISKLNYSIDIQEDGSSKSTINGSSVTVPASTKVYLNITLTSVNEIDSKLNAPGLLPNQKIDLQNELHSFLIF